MSDYGVSDSKKSYLNKADPVFQLHFNDLLGGGVPSRDQSSRAGAP